MGFLQKQLIIVFLVTFIIEVAALCSSKNLKCQGVNFTSVRCSWDRPSINKTYTVQWTLDLSTRVCEGSKMINGTYICDIHDLGYGNYRHIQLRVKSHSDNQTMVFINNYSAKECAIPNPPNDVQVKPVSSNSFQVTWEVPKDWPVAKENLLTYLIRYRSQFNPPDKWEEIQGSRVRGPPYALKVTSLLYHCSIYYIKIIGKTFGATGKQSAWSNVVSVKTVQLAPIGELRDIDIQDLQGKAGGRIVLLTWKPIPLTQTCSPLLGYRVVVCKEAEECTPTDISPNRTSYYVKGLRKESMYTIYLSSYNAVGQSKQNNITIPGLPMPLNEIKSSSKRSYLLYLGLAIPLAALTMIIIWVVYKKLKSTFKPVPEPHIPSYPEYKLNPNPYSSPDDKEFYTLLNESSNGDKSIPRNTENKAKEPVYNYRSVSVSNTGELEVVEYQLLLCEDYVKSSSEKDLSSQDSSNDSISPYSKIAGSTGVDTSLGSTGSKSDSSISARQEVLEKKLQERKCKFIVCRENGYAVIVEDERAQKAENVL
ncbi:Down syndrome cell adhesion molecule-like protein 1 homolog [Anneissia japonica]|uniref:Down syndrome cell adhesion molecule-like protein 1 homolog n=1 Tax=Anneissia japonica TaxID=1529436 RepID=UPI00142592C3|nr:Down syndrome cell adhesion molecule-like protein 1 homolog [Anneissia japonica]XP_033123017.1 Down syndrome cell adhesion molecule-like protein 1 homolog [Anneissia japonica]